MSRARQGAIPPSDEEMDAETLSDLDQTISDGDQSGSDIDEMTADSDQTASDRDQLASDSDQDAADHDQAAADRAQGEGGEDELQYARSRRTRSHNTAERDLTSQARSDTSRIRNEAAARRDRLADERDGAARARDELAAKLDAEIERLELDGRAQNGTPLTGMDVLMRAAIQRKRAAAARVQAAAHREAAAHDRERAALDRRQAAIDRESAADDLAIEGIDHLTGALRRRIGLAAIQRELDRTLRTGDQLVLAFVDVDGLKAVNVSNGHAAGDDLLRAAARSIAAHLRSYDVIVRYGGDEFICSLAGQDVAGVRERFEQIGASLAKTSGATFTIGFAERLEGESLDDLIARADNAMVQARQRRES